ncbi:hypothetical protein [Marinomonas shanghaiensis]|uniref:hypothetical protein n=1 Tax=Marinomonas shanghaiensis TaxID=2202418 RepID=UPI003A8D92A7
MFSVGNTAVAYSITCSGGQCISSFTAFVETRNNQIIGLDGFRYPLDLQGWLGVELEFGTIYDYKPYTWTMDFPNLGYKEDNKNMMFLVEFGPRIIGYGTILLAFIVSYHMRAWSHFFLRVFAVAACVYIVSVFLVFSYDGMLDFFASTYDLNANGMFETNEYTHELNVINQKIVRDTGRTFYPITEIFISLFLSLVFLSIFSAYRYIKLKVMKKD